MYDHMIYGYMIEEHTEPIEITIYTNLKDSILQEQSIIIENGGYKNLELYSKTLKRPIIIHIRSMDCAGESGQVSKHGPSIKIKKEQSTLGGNDKGIPVLIPTKEEEVAYFDPNAIKDPSKLRIANNKYKDVLEFVNLNAKLLIDIWNCVTPDMFNNLIQELINCNSNLS